MSPREPSFLSLLDAVQAIQLLHCPSIFLHLSSIFWSLFAEMLVSEVEPSSSPLPGHHECPVVWVHLHPPPPLWDQRHKAAASLSFSAGQVRTFCQLLWRPDHRGRPPLLLANIWRRPGQPAGELHLSTSRAAAEVRAEPDFLQVQERRSCCLSVSVWLIRRFDPCS